MALLFRVIVLKEIHGWDHETALVEYLDDHPTLCGEIGFEDIPGQSTLWRSWNQHFTANLRETVETVVRTNLIKAQNAGVDVPPEPERKLRHRPEDSDEPEPDDETVLEQTEKLTDHVVRTEVHDAIEDVFEEFDLLVSPTVCHPPVANSSERSTLGPDEVDGEPVDPRIGWCPTYLLNFSGHPAASIPAGTVRGGLPVGMQIAGPRFADDAIFAASAAFERLRSWSHRYRDGDNDS
ncbi:amidase family protein [Haloarchaeobius sp. DFWS5]|uniref:amidase family protein n=1 Tax=Haloarchaeobius sp. DFWS5 TaxID=3446114 RepID=UPI003EBF5FD2